VIVVTGATGTVGRLVVDGLIAAGQPVRAMTRAPERAGLPPGVEVVAGDLDRPDSLLAAFRGAEKIFLLSAPGPASPAQDGRAATVAREAGVSYVVKLSALGADTATEDPIGRWHLSGERAVAKSGLAYTFLRPNGFMTNALRWARSIREEGTVSVPFARAPSAVIDPADIAAVALVVLSDASDLHDGKAYPLTGPEALSAADQVAALADALSWPIKVIDVPPEIARDRMVAAGMAPDIADALMARGRAGTPYDPSVHQTVERLVGRPARSYKQWVADHVNCFRSPHTSSPADCQLGQHRHSH